MLLTQGIFSKSVVCTYCCWVFFQGTVWYSLFKWPIVANLTSSLGYTASSLGNHELDDGVDDLVDYLKATRNAYPTLCCNVKLDNEPGK